MIGRGNLPSRERLIRLRLRRFKPGSPKKPKKGLGGRQYEYLRAVAEVYSAPFTAQLLSDLGRRNMSKPRAIMTARSVECQSAFLGLQGGDCDA